MNKELDKARLTNQEIQVIVNEHKSPFVPTIKLLEAIADAQLTKAREIGDKDVCPECGGKKVAKLDTPNCPQCNQVLYKVRQSPNSPLNSEQFASIRAGDWYCKTCKGNEAERTKYKYFWDKDLEQPCPTCHGTGKKDRLSQFKEALEQSRKGEPLNLSEEAFELFSAIENNAVSKAYKDRLDRPELREKLKEGGFTEWDIKTILAIKPTEEEIRHPLLEKIHKTNVYYLRELKSQVEEAVKDERERIILWGHEYCPHAGPPNDDPTQEKMYCNACWQALKEGKE